MGGGRDTIPILSPEAEERKAKHSLFEILGFIEQLSFNERKGIAISEEAITTISFTRYIETGFKYSLFATLIIATILPLNFGVLDKVIPVFGSHDLKWYDICFILLHSCYPSIGIALLAFAIFHKCFMGPITTKAVQCLRRGLVWGKVVGTVAGWFGLQGFYFFIIKNAKTYKTLTSITNFLFSNNPGLCVKINYTIYNLGHSVVLASWFLIVVFILHLVILYSGSWIGKRKTEKIIKYREKWGLPSWISYTSKKAVEDFSR